VRLRTLLLAALCLTACRTGRSTDRELAARALEAEAGVFRFPHESPAHGKLGCVDCHAEAFRRPPDPFCGLCHAAVDPTDPAGTRPAPYPPTRGRRARASRFGHALHLDKARLDRAVGFHVACADCHARAPGAADPARPGHTACGRCHAGDKKTVPRPHMTQCLGCHAPRPQDPSRLRQLIRGDLRFRHDRHDAERAGKEIACTTCHVGVARAGEHVDLSALARPKTGACVDCHDDERRAPPEVRMARCETCHERSASLFTSTLAMPRSHLPPRDRPEDHTLAFRTDHSALAEREAPRCARCHTGMSGSGRDNCDECHMSTRPRDHLVSWAELDHGPEAATSSDRCAVCHGGEFCTTCHAREPRSHFPLDLWALQHGRLAGHDTRACLACHDYGRFCAGCHTP